jgi:hypothetical protein
MFLTHHPIEEHEWNVGQWGEDLAMALRLNALTGPNPDLVETLARLKARWAEIEEAA